MALLKALLIISTIAYVSAGPLCSNADEKTKRDVEDLREFLANLPSKVENESKYPVIPGELSPLVPCQKENRQKRNSLASHSWRRNKCPAGYQRIGLKCVRRFEDK